MNTRHVIVIGAGVIGATTAFESLSRGIETTLIDALSSIASGTSYANGSMLTPSMSDPWNAPGVHWLLLKSLFDPGSAMKLRASAIPSLATWGLRFLLNAQPMRYRAATQASFALAHYSVARMRSLRDAVALNYDVSTLGTLKVFRSAAAMAGPLELARMLAPHGLRFESLDAEGTIAEEPALNPIRGKIAGALRFRDDESGDARRFSEGLLEHFRARGGTILLGTRVAALDRRGKAVAGVVLSDGRQIPGRVIVATGSATPRLVEPLGIRLPIRPAKGYTLTFDTDGVALPRLPVIDDARHAAIVPIGNRLRVAGTAEFAGEDLSIRPERIANLAQLLTEVYPRIADALDLAAGQPWAGLRPMSADGLPFIGATNVPGLYINAGHGHLGWTLAAGSAALALDAVTGTPSAIDSRVYEPGRR